MTLLFRTRYKICFLLKLHLYRSPNINKLATDVEIQILIYMYVFICFANRVCIQHSICVPVINFWFSIFADVYYIYLLQSLPIDRDL